MKTETITWNQLPADGMPDADIVVDMEIDYGNGTAEVWPGWWNGYQWVEASTGMAIDRTTHSVIAWADRPAGSRAC